MFYTIYKITNTINGKVYIGKHKTKNLDDGYMGSGKLIQRAIERHGIKNFQKEILHKFNSEEEMNTKEAELVTEEFCARDDTYNLCPGGMGGWGYVNQNGLGVSDNQKTAAAKNVKNIWHLGGKAAQKILKEKRLGIYAEDFERFDWTGRKHSEETKQKMRKPKNQGKSNSQFGTMWITNGTENKKIKKVDVIPEGWYKGRN